MTTTDLVPVFAGTLAGTPAQLCNARDLHAALGVGCDFVTWIKRRIAEYGFVEGEDFVFGSSVLRNQTGRGGDRRSRDYHLTLDMAKELAMIENNEIGRNIRRYLIALEKKQQSAPAAPIGDALKASIAEAVKQAIAAQMAPAPAQLPAMKMSIDPRRLIDLMTDLRKIYARLDALGIVASDLPTKWWDQHAVHGIGEPVSRG